jgi:hypothetical protein
LEEFNLTIETEELIEGDLGSAQEKDEFFLEANKNVALWQALFERQPVETQIYIGES